MNPIFYIASSHDRLDDVRELADWLSARGMACSFSWWDHFDHACSSWTCGIRGRQHLARTELAAAGLTADLFIGIARMGKGSHVELGAALAIGTKRVILVGVNPGDSVFYDAACVEHVPDLPALRRLLIEVP